MRLACCLWEKRWHIMSKSYTVKGGDTLSAISMRQYGGGYAV